MPHVKYILRLEGEDFEEKDILEHTDDPTKEIEKIVSALNLNRRKLNEPLIELVSVIITNPFYHLHSWIRTHEVKWVEKVYYTCKHCKITGSKKIGHLNGCVTRDEQFKAERYDICRDELKELPKLSL